MKSVLAIDLSTPHGRLAVVREDDVVLAEHEFSSHRSHNSMLYGPLAAALDTAGDSLQSIVVGTGPGSYVGVRISIAAAYGVALSRRVPVMGLPSITTMSDAAEYLAIGDARRGKFYASVVRDGALANGFALLDGDELREWIAARPGLEICTSDASIPMGIEGGATVVPSAVRLARHALRLGVPVTEEEIEPLYVQEAFVTKAKTPTMGPAAV